MYSTNNIFFYISGGAITASGIKSRKVLKQEAFLKELKTRFRNITNAPDGLIWILTYEPEGRMLKLTPKR